MASSWPELYSVRLLHVTLLVYFEEKCCFIPNYTRCNYDTKTAVSFKPRSSNGIHCVSFVAFLKVSAWECFFEVKRFDTFCARFHRFHARFLVNESCIFKENFHFSRKRLGVNVVALVADDYQTEMKLALR